MSDSNGTPRDESGTANGGDIVCDVADIAFGMTVDEVINRLGHPTARYETTVDPGSSTTVLEWDNTVCCWFDATKNGRLSTIQVTDPAFRVRGMNVIGRHLDEVERRLTPLLGKARRMTSKDINDAIAVQTDRRFPDELGISTLEYEDVMLWCEESIIYAVMWSSRDVRRTIRFPDWAGRFLRRLAKRTGDTRVIATEQTDAPKSRLVR